MAAKKESSRNQSDLEIEAHRLKEAKTIVSQQSKYSFAVGFVPLPLVDIAAITVLHIQMIKKIANLYDLDYSDVMIRGSVSSLVAATAPQAIGVGGTAIKMIPVIGTAVSMMVSPALCGMFTQAVGHVFIQHFESGGDLVSIDVSKMKEELMAKLSREKEVAKAA